MSVLNASKVVAMNENDSDLELFVGMISASTRFFSHDYALHRVKGRRQ